jgi:hypothetical protein
MKKFALLFCLVFTGSSMAQSDENIENQFTINGLWPGASYEFSVAKNTSVKVDAGISLGVISFDGASFDMYPRFDAQLRRYYNFERRSGKSKNTKGNSGNFYGLHLYYTSDVALLGTDFDPEILNILLFGPAAFETFYVGATYGMQRTYPSGFNWGLQFGLGVISVDYTETGSAVTVTNEFSVYPNLRVTFGWVLEGRKNK